MIFVMEKVLGQDDSLQSLSGEVSKRTTDDDLPGKWKAVILSNLFWVSIKSCILCNLKLTCSVPFITRKP